MFDHVTALSFDCYGTLIDWESGLAAVLGPWARSFDPSVSDEDVLAGYGYREAQIERDFPRLTYPEVVERSFRLLGRDLGVPVDDGDALALRLSIPAWPAFPDSAAALTALAERFALVILSNVDRASFEGSRKLLGVDFAKVLTAQDIGSYKPSDRNFEVLRRYAEEENLHLVHVAQSLFHDHDPARRAGIPTVWINRRRGLSGWGATPPPEGLEHPEVEFPSMQAFAAAVLDAPAAERS